MNFSKRCSNIAKMVQTEEERLSLRADIIRHKSLSTVEQELAELKRKLDWNEMKITDDMYEKSTITQYFRSKTIFLTGGAGFLGQVYIEKLLR